MTLPSRRTVNVPTRERGNPEGKSQEEVIAEAKLKTNPAEQTNPEPETEKAPEVEDKKPWRAGTNLSEEELMILTEKISINLPLEASLLVNYLVADQRVGGLGRKYTKTNFIVEAIMDKAKRDLKKRKGINYSQ